MRKSDEAKVLAQEVQSGERDFTTPLSIAAAVGLVGGYFAFRFHLPEIWAFLKSVFQSIF